VDPGRMRKHPKDLCLESPQRGLTLHPR
jgi:hypothetical protein